MLRARLSFLVVLVFFVPVAAFAQSDTDFSLSPATATDITTDQVSLFVSSTTTTGDDISDIQYQWYDNSSPFGACGTANSGLFSVPASDINATDTLSNLDEAYVLDSCGGTGFSNYDDLYAGTITLVEYSISDDERNGGACGEGEGLGACELTGAVFETQSITFSGVQPSPPPYICVLYSDTSGDCAYYEATSTPLYTQDAGDLQYEIAWLIFMSTVAFVAFMWNMIRRN